MIVYSPSPALSADIRDALEGTSGTPPSGTNKFIDNGVAGTSATAVSSSNKLVDAADTLRAPIHGWRTALDWDISAEENTAIATNGPYTFTAPGATTKVNSALDRVAMAIVNGQGLQVRPATSGTSLAPGVPGLVFPRLEIPFVSFGFVPDWDTRLRLYYEIYARGTMSSGFGFIGISIPAVQNFYKGLRFGTSETLDTNTGSQATQGCTELVPSGCLRFDNHWDDSCMLYTCSPFGTITNFNSWKESNGGRQAYHWPIPDTCKLQLGCIGASGGTAISITIKRIRLDYRDY